MAALVLAVGPVAAAEDTTGKVTIQMMAAGVGLGATWGDGVLEYRGEKYPFTVRGFDVGDVGVAKVIANGMVFNLKNVEDFSGMFAAVVAGVTFGGGAESGAMYNNNKVSMGARTDGSSDRPGERGEAAGDGRCGRRGGQ